MRLSPTLNLAAPPAAAALIGAFVLLETMGHGASSQPAGLWEWGYRAAFSVYLLPFLPAAGLGFAARVLAALALQAAAAAPFLAGLPGLAHEPCLLSAAGALAALALARRGRGAAGAAAVLLLALGAAATLATARHEWTELAMGLALGWASYRLAFSASLDPLESAGLSWALHELRDLGNLVLGRRRWEDSYAEGHWDFLDSLDQRPRHFAVAGLVADAFPNGASVLDVGCGLGTTYRSLARTGLVYRGIDCSSEAVARCRRTFGEGPDRVFESVAFERLDSRRRYDVVILNEVLYYFPLAEAERVFRKARALLSSEQGLLIVSMNRNWKAALLWRRLARLAAPTIGMRVTNLRTGSYWTVQAYHARAELPPRTPPAGQRVAEELCRLLEADPPSAPVDLMAPLAGDRVLPAALELDCGDGSMTRELSDRALSVTALGPEARCEAAAELVADRRWVEFVPARPSAWTPPAGRRYDLIAAGAALDGASPERLAARLRGWLVPGGRVIVASLRGARARQLLEAEGLTLVREEEARGWRVSLLERGA